MQRRLEFIDVLVAIGFVATMYGGYLLYIASYGSGVATAGLASPHAMSVPVRASLQTAMGEAIVERAILDRQFSDAVLEGAQKLGQAAFAMERRADDGLGAIEARAEQLRAEYAGVLQYVLGTMIVNLTSRGVRQGLLTPDNLDHHPFNARIIATTTSFKEAAEAQFNKTWQTRLGHWIVDAATKERQFVRRMQERIGQATVALARAQYHYLTKRAKIDAQFHALASAAERVERQTNAPVQTARAGVGVQQTLGLPSPVTSHVVSARTWSEIPFGMFVLAFGGLAAVFFIGLAMPSKRQEPPDITTRIVEVTREIYRKTG